MVDNQQQFAFENIQYKKLLPSELTHLHFKLCDDSGKLAQFKDKVTLTLHIRDAASSEDSML